MSLARTLLGSAIRGMLLGAFLALVAPESQMSAGDDGCKCDDAGSGSYACNAAQTACGNGVEDCILNCTSS